MANPSCTPPRSACLARRSTLESRLNFNEHRSCCAAKASTALTGIALLPKAKGGLKPKFVRRPCESIVVRRLLWGSEFSCKTGVAVSKRLEAVQRAGARLVARTYRTVSFEAAEVEAGLLPLDLQIRRRRHAFALSLHSLSPSHGAYQRYRLARIARSRKYPSPFHDALHSFPSTLPPSTVIETLHPVPLVPWDVPPSFSTVIAASREEGIETYQNRLLDLPPNSVVVHSDGSLMDELAGSGVVIDVVREGGDLRLTKRRALGRDQTVYVGELDGFLHALDTLLPILPSLTCTSLTICIDNQAVLLHPIDPSATAGQQLRLLIRQRLKELKGTYPSLSITPLWSPGHEGLEGNELADEMAKDGVELGRSILKEEGRVSAKEAKGNAKRLRTGMARLYEGEGMSESSEDEEDEWGREGDESWTLALERSRREARKVERNGRKQQSKEEEGLRMPKSVSAPKQAEREESMTSWRKRWSSSGVGQGLRGVDPRPPGPAYNRHIHSLSSENAALLCRLRTDLTTGATKRFLPDDSPDRLCTCVDEVQ